MLTVANSEASGPNLSTVFCSSSLYSPFHAALGQQQLDGASLNIYKIVGPEITAHAMGARLDHMTVPFHPLQKVRRHVSSQKRIKQGPLFQQDIDESWQGLG